MTTSGARLAECDIIMKGGITSGVVYPKAILRMSKQYRFRSIGGTSAGAIAAVITAAAEHNRNGGVEKNASF
jgi:predicted acylesterase/phospholipase RssA